MGARKNINRDGKGQNQNLILQTFTKISTNKYKNSKRNIIIAN